MLQNSTRSNGNRNNPTKFPESKVDRKQNPKISDVKILPTVWHLRIQANQKSFLNKYNPRAYSVLSQFCSNSVSYSFIVNRFFCYFEWLRCLENQEKDVKKLPDLNQKLQRIATRSAFTKHWWLLYVLNETELSGISQHTFLFSLGVAFGDGAGLGDGELNKSASSSSKSPEDFSLAALVS